MWSSSERILILTRKCHLVRSGQSFPDSASCETSATSVNKNAHCTRFTTGNRNQGCNHSNVDTEPQHKNRLMPPIMRDGLLKPSPSSAKPAAQYATFPSNENVSTRLTHCQEQAGRAVFLHSIVNRDGRMSTRTAGSIALRVAQHHGADAACRPRSSDETINCKKIRQMLDKAETRRTRIHTEHHWQVDGIR